MTDYQSLGGMSNQRANRCCVENFASNDLVAEAIRMESMNNCEGAIICLPGVVMKCVKMLRINSDSHDRYTHILVDFDGKKEGILGSSCENSTNTVIKVTSNLIDYRLLFVFEL